MTGPQEVVCQLKVTSVSPADSKAQNDEDGTENDQSDDGNLEVLGAIIQGQSLEGSCCSSRHGLGPVWQKGVVEK
jgi:hypothetical protein